MKYNVITEGLARHGKRIQSIPTEERRRIAIEKAKSSTEIVIASYVLSKHIVVKELKTESTGSVYDTEEYVDYNSFLNTLLRLIYDFGDENTWKPEGKLEYKVDEGIGQASIKDTGTRASVINMSNLAPFMINIMKEQRSESARFFGRMCEAFLERRLPADVVAKIREKLWNDGQCENLFESVKNLGLNKQAKNKFNDVDAVENVSQIKFEDPEVERICHDHDVYTIGDAIKVTSIKGWFNNNDKIKSFDEFKYFTGLKDIELSAFENCISLQSIYIPNSVTSIGEKAFFKCYSLQSINIPDSVTSIGDGAFYECSSFQSINIPDSVTSIGNDAFYWSENLQTINIPDNVTSIGDWVFVYCRSLQSIYISKNCPVYKKIRRKYPSIQLIEPKVNEASSLGLNKQAKKKHDELDAVDNINDYVDLGLPSGTLWCRYNYGSGEESIPGKYINYNDALRLDLSPGILPTKEDFKELYTNCYHKWTNIRGKNGQLFTSKTNGESVFFPADGFEDKKIFYNDCGVYWSSSLYFYSSNDRAIAMFISKTHIDPQYDYLRTVPFSIKTVVKKTNEDFSLGLNKKAKTQFNNTSGNTIEDIGGNDLDIDEFKQYFYDEFSKLKYFNNIKIGHEVQIGYKHHSFIFCYPRNEYKIPDVICRVCHETKKFRVMISYYSNTDSDPKEYVFGAETKDNNEYFFDQKEKADLTIVNILLAKEFAIKSIEEIISKNPLDESMNLGLNKRAKSIHSEKSEEDVTEELGNIHFESPEIERVCHEHGVYTREDAANVDGFTAWSIFVDIKRNIHYKFHEFKYFTRLEKVFHSLFSYTKLEEITLPLTARSIGNHTFRGTLLKSIVIPEGVDEIGDQAFEDCKDLEEIWIPNSLRNLGMNPFSGCYRLKNIYVKKDCPDVVIERITKYLPSIISPKVIKVDEYPSINESINLGLNSKAKQKFNDIDAIDNISDYVDLDLPSGILWCTKNIGADTEEDSGDLLNYQDAVMKTINLSMTLPHVEDFEELNTNCSLKWIETVDSNGNPLSGMMFTSEWNGNKIFFPAAGHFNKKYNSKIEHHNLRGHYWTSEKADTKMNGNYYWSCIFTGMYRDGFTGKIEDKEDFYNWMANEIDTMSVRPISRKRKQRT